MARSVPRANDDDDWGTWPGELEWQPSRQDPGVPQVYEFDTEPVGELELPDGTVIEVWPARPSFGFGRWLDDE